MTFTAACAMGEPSGFPIKMTELDRLRAVLLSAPNGDPQTAADWGDDNAPAFQDDRRFIRAAVLFPIVLRDSAPHVLLTRRTDHLKDHPGQICFPGGRVDPADRSPAETALRETREETGISPDRIDVIGYLPDRWTITGFRITPVVATLRPPLTLRPAAFEVAEIFETPLAFLLDTANHRAIVQPGKTAPLISIAWQERVIWGATAAMIHLLAQRIAAAFPA